MPEQLTLRFKDMSNVFILSEFYVDGHIATVSGREVPHDNTNGFYVSRDGHADNWDYTAFTTIYRIIDEDTIQFSNDGSVYQPPMKNLSVSVNWNDGEDAYKVRPSVVIAEYYVNGVKTKINVRASKNWVCDCGEIPADSEVTVKARAQEHYSESVSGTTISFYLPVPQKRGTDQEELNKATIDLAEGYQPVLTNTYASMCENGFRNFGEIPERDQEAVKERIEADGFIILEDGTTVLKPLE